MTKIFLDSGSAEETKSIIEKLGFLHGQTTNPTYFAKKNPTVLAQAALGKKFNKEKLLSLYKKLAQEISSLIPEGSISLEVYADKDTSFEEIIEQARDMYVWIPNAHIKIPIIDSGLKAAQVLAKEGMRLNMTLCFSQEQAAAVHAATHGATPGQIYISPFVSRLDKIGFKGFDLLMNIKKMYEQETSHVSILAASVHSVFAIARILENKFDIITIPYDDLLAWIEAGRPHTTKGLSDGDMPSLRSISYIDLNLKKDWQEFDIRHKLTKEGLQKFANDWNSLLK